VLATGVMRNNVQVAFLAFTSGITAGVLSVFVLVMNGLMLGGVIGLFVNVGAGGPILEVVTAPGPFELTAICIAAAGGVLLAAAIQLPGPRTRRAALVQNGRRALRLLAAAALFLVFAGIIEGLVSPRTDIPVALKIAFAVASTIAMVVYFTLGLGRTARVEEEFAYRRE
jgi:uncharacterized membrane protein SpoIIM required for sporulation